MTELFSTKERLKILTSVIFEEGAISVNDIARRTRLSKGLVSKYLDLLVRFKIAYKSSNKHYIDKASHLLKGVKILLNVEGINVNIFKKYKFIESVGLYGSLVKGENTSESDVDLWLKIKDVSDERLAVLSAELRKKINNVRPLFLTNSKIEQMQKDDVIFWHSLVFGSLPLYGDDNGIQL